MAKNIQQPHCFDFKKLEQWPAWIKRFDRFKNASGLDGEPEEKQIDMLLYVMGEEAEDLLTSFHLSFGDGGIYKKVKDALQKHFDVTQNVIFERTVSQVYQLTS